MSHCGETGRRDGFKIHLGQLSVGSSPTSGTIKNKFYILTLQIKCVFSISFCIILSIEEIIF